MALCDRDTTCCPPMRSDGRHTRAHTPHAVLLLKPTNHGDNTSDVGISTLLTPWKPRERPGVHPRGPEPNPRHLHIQTKEKQGIIALHGMMEVGISSDCGLCEHHFRCSKVLWTPTRAAKALGHAGSLSLHRFLELGRGSTFGLRGFLRLCGEPMRTGTAVLVRVTQGFHWLPLAHRIAHRHLWQPAAQRAS